MKENFFNSMLMEGGKISHKRWISVTISAVLAWAIFYTTRNSPNLRMQIINSTMVFILVMSGVATVAQVVGLFRGGPTPPPETKPTTEDKPE